MNNYILVSDTDNYTSIFASDGAALSGGIMYVAASGILNKVDISKLLIIDNYATTFSGRSGDVLVNDMIYDINVV